MYTSRLHELTEQVVEATIRDVPEFAQGRYVPRADQTTSVLRNLEMALLGIAERRGPTEAELEIRRELGRRRASQDLPLGSLVAAFHIGYRTAWDALVEEALVVGGQAPDLLLRAGATIWGWMQDVLTAVSDEYQKEAAKRETMAARRRAQFLDVLMQDPEAEDSVELARGFGLNPEGRFCAIAMQVQGIDDLPLSLRTLLDERRAFLGERGRTAIALFQGTDSSTLRQEISLITKTEPIGIGFDREGLAGARLSAIDAERALDVALSEGRVCMFEDAWLEAVALSHHASVAPILNRGVEAARAHPHLANTLTVFAESGLSLAEAARRFRLAPNSLRHRLERWERLTGWDPRSIDGINRSIMSIKLLRRLEP